MMLLSVGWVGRWWFSRGNLPSDVCMYLERKTNCKRLLFLLLHDLTGRMSCWMNVGVCSETCEIECFFVTWAEDGLPHGMFGFCL